MTMPMKTRVSEVACKVLSRGLSSKGGPALQWGLALGLVLTMFAKLCWDHPLLVTIAAASVTVLLC